MLVGTLVPGPAELGRFMHVGHANADPAPQWLVGLFMWRMNKPTALRRRPGSDAYAKHTHTRQ